MSGYTRKTASIFSLNEIKRALLIEDDTPKWLLRKAVIVVAYCGGMRGAEVRKIQLGNVQVDEEGVWVEFLQVNFDL